MAHFEISDFENLLDELRTSNTIRRSFKRLFLSAVWDCLNVTLPRKYSFSMKKTRTEMANQLILYKSEVIVHLQHYISKRKVIQYLNKSSNYFNTDALQGELPSGLVDIGLEFDDYILKIGIGYVIGTNCECLEELLVMLLEITAPEPILQKTGIIHKPFNIYSYHPDLLRNSTANAQNTLGKFLPGDSNVAQIIKFFQKR